MRFCLLTFLLLLGCQVTSNWECVCIPSKETDECSRLLYTSQNPNSGIDLEFLCSNQELTLYLQVHSSELSPCQKDPKKIQISVQFDGIEKVFFADFHAGKQRARLGDSLKELFLLRLKENQSMIITLEGYQEILEIQGFEKHFKDFCKKASLKNL